MFLYLKRSQRHVWFGRRIYKLSAHIEASPEQRRVIASHRFAAKLAFVEPLDHVEALERRAEAAYQHQARLSILRQENHATIVWDNLKVIALTICAAYARHTAFRVSIDDLLRGVDLEGPFNQVLETEANILKAFDALKQLVEHAMAFEQHRETVLQHDDRPRDQLAPPSTWPRHARQ